jgi:hypothetical protein
MTREIDPRITEVIDNDFAEILRQKTPASRRCKSYGAKLAATGIRDYHPDWSELQVEREVAMRMPGKAT